MTIHSVEYTQYIAMRDFAFGDMDPSRSDLEKVHSFNACVMGCRKGGSPEPLFCHSREAKCAETLSDGFPRRQKSVVCLPPLIVVGVFSTYRRCKSEELRAKREAPLRGAPNRSAARSRFGHGLRRVLFHGGERW